VTLAPHDVRRLEQEILLSRDGFVRLAVEDTRGLLALVDATERENERLEQEAKDLAADRSFAEDRADKAEGKVANVRDGLTARLKRIGGAP
jgi:hypothetical protein